MFCIIEMIIELESIKGGIRGFFIMELAQKMSWVVFGALGLR